jgi:non-heme chloroperoxidase
MTYIDVGSENTHAVSLYYEDLGQGTPILLIHGYPLNGQSFEKQVPVLLKAGFRVIAYDRRGFGASSKPAMGYDYDTFASDLNSIMETLDLKEAILLGFSMGTGEVARYLGTYGSGRVAKAVLAGPIPPFLLKTTDNPDGVDKGVFDEMQQAIVADRPAHYKKFFMDFFNYDVLGGSLVSEEALQMCWTVALKTSGIASFESVSAWLEDFRDDVAKIDIPTLIIQGVEDRILPIDSTGRRLPELIKGSQLVEIENGPHNICWTHPQEFNEALLAFINSAH